MGLHEEKEKEITMKRTLKTLLAAFLIMTSMPMHLHAEEDKSWTYENGTWYIVNSDGSYYKGWFKNQRNTWYYMDWATGAMKTKWAAIGPNWFYFEPFNGDMKTGWQIIDGKQYYFKPSGKDEGAMVTGEVIIDGVTHQFAANGEYRGQLESSMPKQDSEILALQQKMYEAKYPHAKEEYLKDIPTNELFFERFEVSTTELLPIGTYDTSLYAIGRKTAAIGAEPIVEAAREKLRWKMVATDAYATTIEDFTEVYRFEQGYNTLTKQVYKKPYQKYGIEEGIYNLEKPEEFLNYTYMLDLDTGLAVVTDFQNKQYCIYNATGTTNYDCYGAMGRNYNPEIGDTLNTYKWKLKESTNRYDKDRQDILDTLQTILDIMN